MVFLSPEGSSREAQYQLAPRQFDLTQGLRLGLLTNKKLNAEEVLTCIGDLLAQCYNITTVTMRNKPSFSLPAPVPTFDELAEECDLVLAGIGD